MAVKVSDAPAHTNGATLTVVEQCSAGKYKLAVVEDGQGLQHLARQQEKKTIVEQEDGSRSRKGSTKKELVWVRSSDLAVWNLAVKAGLVIF